MTKNLSFGLKFFKIKNLLFLQKVLVSSKWCPRMLNGTTSDLWERSLPYVFFAMPHASRGLRICQALSPCQRSPETSENTEHLCRSKYIAPISTTVSPTFKRNCFKLLHVYPSTCKYVSLVLVFEIKWQLWVTQKMFWSEIWLDSLHSWLFLSFSRVRRTI